MRCMVVKLGYGDLLVCGGCDECVERGALAQYLAVDWIVCDRVTRIERDDVRILVRSGGFRG